MTRSGGDLAKRVAVALIGIPVTVVLAYLGGYPLAVLVAAFASLAAWELCVMYRGRVTASAGVAAALALIYVVSAVHVPPESFVLWATALTLSVGAVLMLRVAPNPQPGLSVMVTLFAAAYSGVLLAFAIWLRAMEGAAPSWRGAAVVLLPVAIIWIGDTAAYFVGHAIGRRKLAPRISPNKSWEGAVAGFLATAGGALVWIELTQPLVSWTLGVWHALGFGAAVAVAGQVGDLFESRFKRECGVKDSSGLLPGHGGVLDRMDSLLFGFPIAYLYLRLVGV